ncbi:hypothetical protein BO94DRAFT_461492 [Aspergillus sclerotioniger CBS 115572]|uniref:Protein kinase domain-containing protein n=1 Tax=Aspergillus sclerotioniger CBS 115572 TaxID=1450535 RepID=A0A317WZI6_9EURO|nr:hypothetical protein BO94DRAFT_461492 [Aspergillus sclerotioniger CBS 115572]PWY91796.1 hypothetical protein BO94DRAFT_461492 [Aspergillus sclerotioniger CBS 115572]
MPDTIQVSPSDIQVLQTLRRSEHSTVLKVAVRGETRLMKIYRDRLPSEHDSPDREINPFTCESSAYHRLKEKGLCTTGVIPYFYGIITNIQPDLWPELYIRSDDGRPLNAVVLEYIDNMHQMDLSTFSESRLTQLERILHEIHEAGVLHGDPDPRNMMVCAGRNGRQDRVLWIDFDLAQLPPGGYLSLRQQMWLQEENDLMDYFVKSLPEDYREGRLNRTWNYYYTRT